MIFWKKKPDQNTVVPAQTEPGEVFQSVIPSSPAGQATSNKRNFSSFAIFKSKLAAWQKLVLLLLVALIISVIVAFVIQKEKKNQDTLSTNEYVFIYNKFSENENISKDLYSKFSQDKVLKKSDTFIIKNQDASSNSFSYMTTITDVSDKIIFEVLGSKENKPLAGHFADYIPYFRNYLTKEELSSLSLTKAEIDIIFISFTNEPNKYYLDSLTDSDLRDSLKSLRIAPDKISNIVDLYNKKPQLTILNDSKCSSDITFGSNEADTIPICLKITKTKSTYFVVSMTEIQE